MRAQGTVLGLLALFAGCSGQGTNDAGLYSPDHAALMARGCPPHEGPGGVVELDISRIPSPGPTARAGENVTVPFRAMICPDLPPLRVALGQTVTWTNHSRPAPAKAPEVLQPVELRFVAGVSQLEFHLHIIVPQDSPEGSWQITPVATEWDATASFLGVRLDVVG